MTAAERHRRHADRFTQIVEGVTDWNVPTPVDDWQAIDIVEHLVAWSAEFLASGDVEIPAGPEVRTDPLGAWTHHTREIQSLLDSSGAQDDFTHPHVGTQPLEEAIDRFYTSDIFMHQWDLARATGQDDEIDADEASAMLDGMRQIEQMLRDSGQFGPAVPVADDAPVQDQFIGFIGRDPNWNPR